MSEMESAMAELIGVFRSVVSTDKVTIAGTEYEAMVTELTADDMIQLGGIGNAGGYSVVIMKSLFQTRPAEQSTISYGGMSLQIKSVVETNKATYTIVAFDASV